MPWLALPALSSVLAFFKSPLGIVAVIALAYLGGNWQGRHAANARCEADKQASIEAARQIDQKAASEAQQRMATQVVQAAARTAQAEHQLKEYQNEIAKRAEASGCNLLDDDVSRLERVPNEPSGRPTVAPLPPKRHR